MVSLTLYLPAKLEVCSFSLSVDNRLNKIQKYVTWPRWRLPFSHIFCLLFLTLNPPTKFDVCIFSQSRDDEGVPKFKSRSRDLHHTPFDHFFQIFVWYPLRSITLQNLRIVASAIPEIFGGSKFKSRSPALRNGPLWPSFVFLD